MLLLPRHYICCHELEFSVCCYENKTWQNCLFLTWSSRNPPSFIPNFFSNFESSAKLNLAIAILRGLDQTCACHMFYLQTDCSPTRKPIRFRLRLDQNTNRRCASDWAHKRFLSLLQFECTCDIIFLRYGANYDSLKKSFFVVLRWSSNRMKYFFTDYGAAFAFLVARWSLSSRKICSAKFGVDDNLITIILVRLVSRHALNK